MKASAKALVFLKATHGGLVMGGLHATGFMIARSDHSKWSAPCFVSLNRFEIGAIAGIETADILMASITRQGVTELASEGTHKTFGTDLSFQFWPFANGSSGPDDYASLDVNSDWVYCSISRGLLFDFSLSGSSLSIDEAKNKEAYGDLGVDQANIISGKVPRPQDMAPLYHKINEIASRALA